MAFAHATSVTFKHVDPAGILYFSRVFELCHDAMEALMAASSHPLSSFFDGKPEVILPIVHAEADYKRPMRLGDDIVVHVRIAQTGDSSLTWGFRITSADGQVLHATAQHVHAAVDTHSFRPTRLSRIAAVQEWAQLAG